MATAPTTGKDENVSLSASAICGTTSKSSDPTTPPPDATTAEYAAAIGALMIQGAGLEVRRAILGDPGRGKQAHIAAAERGLQRWLDDLTARAATWETDASISNIDIDIANTTPDPAAP